MPALTAHYARGSTTFAQCMRVTLTNGTVFGFTSVDIDLTIDGVVYLASSGVTPSAMVSTNTLAVDNMEVQAFLDNDLITEGDLNAGLWDYAEVRMFEVNYRNLAAGIRREARGHIGEVSSGRNTFTAELRGLTDAYTRMVGELYGPACRARFGDARCKVDLSDYTVTGSIEAVSADGRIITDTSRNEPGPPAGQAITGISRDKAAVVTSPGHGFKSGQYILINQVSGVTQQDLNGINGRNYVISVLDADRFSIPVDTRPLATNAANGPTSEVLVYSPYVGGGVAIAAGATGYFAGGLMTMTSGANEGLSVEVGTYVPGIMSMRLSFPYPVEVGDTYTMVAGCGKRFVEDCKNKFDNIVNFRGEPHLPGMDQVIIFGGQEAGQGGSSSGGTDGGSSGGGTPTTGNVSGTVTSTGAGTGTIVASVSGAVVGPVTGTVTGSNGGSGTISGTVVRNADGTGTLTGTVTGNVSGAVTGSVSGNTAGLPSPSGTGTGTVTAYIRPYVAAWGYFVYGNVAGNASGWVDGTVTSAAGSAHTVGYVRNDGNGTGFFLGRYMPGATDVSGLATGTLAGHTPTDLEKTQLYPGDFIPVNTRSGYEAYDSWIPSDSRGYVPSYRVPYDTNGEVRFSPILSMRLRLLNRVAGGGSMGTQHYAIDFDYDGSGGEFQPGLYVQFWNMPQTFASGPVTIGPLQSSEPVGAPPPPNYSQAQFERLVLDFWTRSNGPVRPSVADGQVSIFRSMPVNSQAQLDALQALNGTLISTPGALARTFRADPNFPDPYWNSALVNPDGTGGLNID